MRRQEDEAFSGYSYLEGLGSCLEVNLVKPMGIITAKISQKSNTGSNNEATVGTTNASPDSTHHAEAVSGHRATYGLSGFRDLFSNYCVVVCAAFSTLGGLTFGECLSTC